MQTFLPYPDFFESARVLDRQRLGKQRVECLQILRALAGQSRGWRHHPAVRMWEGYALALYDYQVMVCGVWRGLYGYKDTCQQKSLLLAFRLQGPHLFERPPWLGDPAFHAAHRAALLAKNYQHYSQFGWKEEPRIEYVWPV